MSDFEHDQLRDIEYLRGLCCKLIDIGRLDEILDENGHVQASDSAREKHIVGPDGPLRPFLEGLAVRQTILDLASKYGLR